MENVMKRTHMCGVITEKDINERVVLNGWIQKRRNLGGLIFCDLRDKTELYKSYLMIRSRKNCFRRQIA